MKVNFLFILFFIIFNNLNANAFPDKIKIELNPNNFGKYQKNIFRAYVSDGNHIKDRFKKWIDAKIITKDKDLKIKFRITGDWKDHLKTNSRTNIHVYSSILVKVVDDNYEGMTRFKILLPFTRYGNDHLFWNSMLNYYNYTTLKMRIIEVNMNDISYFGFIEELPTKEFLESNLEREGPILEYDERIHWKNQKELIKIREFVVNKQVKKFNNYEYREANSPKIINKQYLKNFNAIKIASDAIYLFSLNNFEDYIDNSDFYFNITKKYASHGLALQNRNFFYQPYKFKLYEIYKEGNVKLGGDNIKIEDCNLNKINKKDKSEFRNFLKKYDFQFKISTKMECSFYDLKSEYKKKQNIIDKPLLKVNNNFTKEHTILINKIKKYFKENFNLNNIYSEENKIIQKYSLMHDDKTFVCDYDLITEDIISCNEISLDQYVNIISGDNKNYVSGGFKLFPINLGNLSYKINTKILKLKNDQKFYNLSEDLTYIANFENIENLDVVTFDFSNPNSRLILEGNIKDLDINFANSKNVFTEEIIDNIKKGRFNSKSLTGCVTFLNSSFENVTLNAKNFMCEDSINILNSSGKIKNINISNSLFDALDIDFSNIEIENVNIKNAENDCLDFSAGTYEIKNLIAQYCGDKGISVGEKSNVKFSNAKVEFSNIAVASKDSSKVEIDNIKIDESNICLSAYRKKQEFGSSFLKVGKFECLNFIKKLDKDELSQISIVN